MALNGYNYHYTTDSMTARQRAALEQGRRYTHDETGKPMNYTARNGARPDLPTPAVHIHLHTDDSEDDPASPEGIAARRPAMREPGLDPGNDADTDERLDTLEVAVARLAMQQMGSNGYSNDPDDNNGEGTNNSFTMGGGDPNDVPDVVEQAASQKIANTGDQRIGTAASMQKANEGFWSTKGRTTTGGSGSVPPNSRAAEASNYQPNQAGSVNGNRRMSTVAQNDKMLGRTSGWGTSDMQMQDRASFFKMQRLATNSTIAKINRRNAAARQRAGWGV